MMKQQKQPKTIPRKPKNKPRFLNEEKEFKQIIKWMVLIIILSFIAFSPALKNELVNWDDYNYIRDNPAIKSLSADHVAHLFDFSTRIMGNHHPFTILSYALEYKIAGDHPFLYHLDNLFLHLMNILLFAWIMWRLTRKKTAVIIAAALFALHPMRVESVVWAAERKDLLYTFFFLLSLIFYIQYSLKKEFTSGNYLLSLLFFLFSLFSKGQAVVLPLTFVLIDYWFQKKITARSLIEKIPFFALSLLFGILAIKAQATSLTEQRLISHTFAERIIFAGYNITAYLYKLIFPYKLSCFYGFPPPDRMTLVYLGAIFTLILLVAVFYFLRKNRSIMFGSLFFLLTIVIVIQLLPIGNAIIADRYTYLPYMGLFFIIGMLIDRVHHAKPKYINITTVLIIVQLLVFSTFSFIQSRTWQNNETLWKQVIKNNPEEGLAYNNLGTVYLQNKDYPTALNLFRKAVEYRITYPEVSSAYTNLGNVFSETGDKRRALHYFDTAILVTSGASDAYFNRGLLYSELQKYDSAILDFTYLIRNKQQQKAEWYYSRGMAYKNMNSMEKAIADYTEAIKINPGYASAYTNLGNIYFTMAQFEKAITNYNIALGYAPEDGNTYLNRSFAYFKNNQFSNALADAEKAASLNEPVSPEYIKILKSGMPK